MALALHTMLEALFGITSFPRENPLVDEIGVAAVRFLANNPQRVSFQIVNLSANALYIATTNEVAATRGIMLGANGGIASLIWDRDFELVSHEWWGLAAGANSAVYVLENIIQ